MSKLFLFDIDGTLVAGVKGGALTTSSGDDRFVQAIKIVTGENVELDKDFRGLTDQLILKNMLYGKAWDDQRIEAVMPQLIVELDCAHQRVFNMSEIVLLAGVKELLTALKDHHQVLGLLTGNLEPVARRKLEALGVWSYFSAGGFGSDPHTTRADLVQLAIGRAGFQGRLDDVFLIGDTPRDIAAAQEAGLSNSVGVANGFRDISELKAAGAKIVLDDFRDINYVLAALGVV